MKTMQKAGDIMRKLYIRAEKNNDKNNTQK